MRFLKGLPDTTKQAEVFKALSWLSKRGDSKEAGRQSKNGPTVKFLNGMEWNVKKF